MLGNFVDSLYNNYSMNFILTKTEPFVKSRNTIRNMSFQRFNYKSLEEIESALRGLGLELPFSDEVEVLREPVKLGKKLVIPNSLAYHPMEGSDGKTDGSPDELTIRRYKRFASGGAGLIWFEAVAVTPEGRASPRQLWIHKDNLGEYVAIRELISETAEKAGRAQPLCIMQLTFSGRFSRPYDKPAPVIAYRNPVLDPLRNVVNDDPIISDDEIKRLEEKFVDAAILAQKAGFEGVDLKGCHLYLVSELFSAYNRSGEYGGSFENRTKMLVRMFENVRSAVGNEFVLSSRLNLCDQIPYPNGWGVPEDGSLELDLSEPIRLIDMLRERGLGLLNVTMGTPYYNPHVNRPYDSGGYVPPEHPLIGVHRLLEGSRQVQAKYPDLPVLATGFTYPRQYAAQLAAGCKKQGWAKLIGFGRLAIANPDFPLELLEEGRLNPDKCCIACGKCAEILRAGGTSGCVIRDKEIYGEIHKKLVANNLH